MYLDMIEEYLYVTNLYVTDISINNILLIRLLWDPFGVGYN